ncbi:hypothetical protein [Streptomyces sp. NPDC006551]|uniref:hypothetical protein n=1 Tax=Streptomyces sp. NPDC006551 TaxID=3157178 RepID=UPI0033A78E7C
MKKYLPAAAAVVAAVVITAPTAVAAPAARLADAGTTTIAAARAATPAATESPVRVLRSGERVDAGRGWTVWLTKEGKHWSGKDGFEEFRSVADGNLDLSGPGVSHQSESDANGAFHSGLYYGTREAGRVELTGADGRRTVTTLLELAGRPGWGVWYAHGPATGADGPAVALYDRTGRLLADLPGTP